MARIPFWLALPLAACSPAVDVSAPGNDATQQSASLPGTPAPVPAGLPFEVRRMAQFDTPFALAFLPDGAVLVTEKPGHLRLWHAGAATIDVAGVPAVAYGGQGGLLDVAIAPDFATSRSIYLSYSEPGPGGSSLALARATLVRDGDRARLDGLDVIWREMPKGKGGQFGAVIAFAPDGAHLFLASGERQRKTPAQDPAQALGKILRMNLDGSVPADNPMAHAGGARAYTWSTGHRNPYGLVFAPDGRLWENEMGPQGGDELNLILPGRNYGWPVVSNGDNYDGSPIPDHSTRPEFEAPKLWWNPSVSPGGSLIYSGTLFPQWRGSYFMGALSGQALIRITLDGTTARKADQWDMGERIRDVAQGPDGELWLLEDDGWLVRLTPRAS